MRRAVLAVLLASIVTATSSPAAAQNQPIPEQAAASAPASPAAPVAAAQADASFGTPRQVVISSDLFLDFGYNSVGSRSRVVANLSTDYFVAGNVSLGGVIGYSQGDTSANSTSTYRVGVRGGYNIRINSILSIWPRLGVELHGDSLKATARGSNDNFGVAVAAFAPALVHPAPHLFIGFGPYVSADLYAKQSGGVSGSEKALDLGARLVLGGYWGI